MCGRFSSKSQREVIASLYRAGVTSGDYLPSPNVAPTEFAPIVREASDNERTVDPGAFGIPTIAGPRSFLLTNIQSEKASGRKDLKDRRCIVPADGFYEWETLGPKDKQPHFFAPVEGLFSLAAVWRQTERGLAFSLFTTSPNEMIAPLHHRMPVILGHNAVSQWLAPEAEPETLMGLMQPYPSDLMRHYTAGRSVNNARNKAVPELVPV